MTDKEINEGVSENTENLVLDGTIDNQEQGSVYSEPTKQGTDTDDTLEDDLNLFDTEPVIDDVKKSVSKGKIKKSVFGIAVSITILGVSIFSYLDYKNSAMTETERVEAYITELTDKNYMECDNLSGKKSEQLIPDKPETMGTFNNSYDMYIELLGKMVDSIESAKYDQKTDTLTIKYKPYKQTTKVTVDEKAVSELVEKYVSNQLTDEDLKRGITDVYMKSFESLNKVDKDAITKELSIPISCEDDTITGIKKGILKLLEKTNLSSNMTLFEKDIKSTLNVELRK